jgi:WD40 repeat protein
MTCSQCGQPQRPGLPVGLCATCLAMLAVEGPPGLELELPPDIGSTDDLGNRVLHYLGDYQLLEEIGRGGMGVVYRARQVSLGRQVAVKMILHGHLASEDQLHRFQMEAATTAQLRHPNIVEVFEVGEDQGQAYFAMEFIPGVTLGDRVRSGPLPPRECAAYMTVVARAVQHAHDLGVLHRDLKPSNILLDQDGRARVTDFGLAKRLGGPSDLTLSGQTFGTPAYIPPEQVAARRGAVTVRSDVYSLGTILYHLLTGRPPFQGAGEAETLRAVLEEEPVAPRTIHPGISRDLETICQRCMAKDPARRYGSAAALADDLDRWMAGLPIEARPVLAPERLWLWAKRKPTVAALTGLLLGAVLAGVGGVLWQWSLAVRHRGEAENRGYELRQAAVRLRAREAENAFTAGRTSEALAELAAAVRLDPSSAQPLHRLVAALNQRGYARPTSPMLTDGSKAMQAAFTPDGLRVVVLNAENELRLWDAQTAQPISPPLPHPGPLDGFEFTDSGARIMTVAKGDSLFIRSSRTGELEQRMELGPGLSAGAAGRSNRWVVAGLTNGQAILRHLRKPDAEHSWQAHSGAVTWASFSQDGRFFVTADSVSQVRAWSVAPPHALLAEISATGRPFELARLSPDGRHLFATEGTGVATVWDLFPPRLVSSNNLAAKATVIAWSPDSSRALAGLENGWITVFDPISGRQVLTFTNHLQTFMAESIFALDVSPDSQTVISGSDDQTVQIWNLQTGARVFEPIHGETSVNDVRFHPDGRRLLAVETHRGVRVRQLVSRRESPLRIVESSGVWALAFTSPGTSGEPQSLVVVLTNGAAVLRDSQRGAFLRKLREPDAPVEFVGTDIRGGRALAIADTKHRVTLLDLRTFRLQDLGLVLPQTVAGVDFSRDGTRVAIASGNGAYCFETATGRLVAGPLSCETNRTYYAHRLFQARFSPDGRYLVTPCYDLHARVWDLAGGQLLGDLSLSSSVYTADFSADSRRLLTASGDRRACIWSLTNLLVPLRVFPAEAPVVDASFSPDERLVAVSRADGHASFWEAATGSRLGEPMIHRQMVRAFPFHRDGQRILSRSLDGMFRVWDVPSGLPLGEFKPVASRPTSLAANADWSVFAVRTGDTEISLWKDWRLPPPAPDWLPELAEAVAGRQVMANAGTRQLGADSFLALRQRLLALPAADEWTRWVHWYLAGADQR